MRFIFRAERSEIIFVNIGALIVFKMRFCYRFDPSYVPYVLSNQGL